MNSVNKSFDHQMNVFIQNMYGVILGVSFYQAFNTTNSVIKDAAHVTPYNWYQAYKDIFIPINGTFENNCIILFKVLLFATTLLIAAHDWFSYHKYEYRSNLGKNKFAFYVPQIASLFFISQMFIASSNVNFKYWFGFAIWYTVCNIINWMISHESIKSLTIKPYGWIYLVHILITVAGFIFIPSHFIFWIYLLALVITLAFVIYLWSVMENNHKQEILVKENMLPSTGELAITYYGKDKERFTAIKIKEFSCSAITESTIRNLQIVLSCINNIDQAKQEYNTESDLAFIDTIKDDLSESLKKQVAEVLAIQ